MDTHAYPDRPVVSIFVKLVAALTVMVVMVAGIFFWGRLADDDRTAMLLTAAWVAVVAVAGVLLTRTHTSLRLPLSAAFSSWQLPRRSCSACRCSATTSSTNAS